MASQRSGIALLASGLLVAASLRAQLSQVAASQVVAPLTAAPRTVTLADGSPVAAEAGELAVPESRRHPTARRLVLPFYRLRTESSTPAAPIFLLAGGPGSSGIDSFREAEIYREVAFYRTIADVVLFDQRGGGHSRPEMGCSETFHLPDDRPLLPSRVRRALRPALAACRDRWRHAGVDLAAYNTVENAEDLDDLRRTLGYDRITLVGGSYGSHLALQYVRAHPQAVDRMVLFGIEGPGQTWDDPAGLRNALSRIAEDIERETRCNGCLPEGGLLRATERAIARLEAAPRRVKVETEGGARTVVVDADLVRRMLRKVAGRRSAPLAWPELVLSLERGDLQEIARTALEVRTGRLASPMHYSMDCASGVSAERRRRFRADPARALLGDVNFEYEALCDLWPAENLGERFRANVVSDVPAVLIHGTWDLSTPIENAREVVATLRRGRLVEVVGGNHAALYNLFQRWPGMLPAMRSFLAGGAADFPERVDDRAAIRFEPRSAAPTHP